MYIRTAFSIRLCVEPVSSQSLLHELTFSDTISKFYLIFVLICQLSFDEVSLRPKSMSSLYKNPPKLDFVEISDFETVYLS